MIADAVLATRDPATRDDARQAYHLRWVWDGRRFDGRDVLVRCYHGLGDTLQFARYLAPLRARAASVTLEVQPELLPLLARVPGADRVIRFAVAHPAPPAACDIEIMELAHALRLPPEQVQPPALAVAPAPIAADVALCWRAGAWDTRRSVPLYRVLAALRPLRVVSAQHKAAAADGDILHTAALLAGAPLVVTVDTMVAHLAGTLGRPTWLLLHADADWRWQCGRTDSPWYPRMRLFRQSVAGDWRAPLAAVRRALRRG